jgi:hypothetical protein
MGWTMVGVTRDKNGNPLGNCTVYLFSSTTLALVTTTTSDVNGNFSFSGLQCGLDNPNIPIPNAYYFVIAFLAGTPDVQGTTDYLNS